MRVAVGLVAALAFFGLAWWGRSVRRGMRKVGMADETAEQWERLSVWHQAVSNWLCLGMGVFLLVLIVLNR